MKRNKLAFIAAVSALPLALSGMTAASAEPARTTSGGAVEQTACTQWIALTFDDGPSYFRTQTLRTLRAKHVPATFFDLGMRVAANPQFSGFEAREGHLVLNHTWSHPDLTTLAPAQVESQVTRTETVLRKAGAPLPFKLLRPPFGRTNPAVDAQLAGLDYHHVAWDVFAWDWDAATTSEQVRNYVVDALRPGLVVLLHDGPVDSAAGSAVETALPQIIERVRRAGYCFGQLNRLGQVVPASLPASNAPIPEVINPVPYLPLGSFSGGQLPPAPYVIVDPATQL